MGVLIDGLLDRRERFVEITLVPLSADWVRNLCNKRRPFFSLAAIYGPAALLAFVTRSDRMRLRVWLARVLLALLRPTALVLIDESGSGQSLLRAARKQGVPVLGIQHGDFQPDNPQYAESFATERGVEPADVLCVWSPWFRERLFAISSIYDASNVRVTGRLRLGIFRTGTCTAEGTRGRRFECPNRSACAPPRRRRTGLRPAGRAIPRGPSHRSSFRTPRPAAPRFGAFVVGGPDREPHALPRADRCRRGARRWVLRTLGSAVPRAPHRAPPSNRP